MRHSQTGGESQGGSDRPLNVACVVLVLVEAVLVLADVVLVLAEVVDCAVPAQFTLNFFIIGCS
jgi:hypothetical protein